MIYGKTSYGLAVLSGILLLLSFPPFNLGAFLAWFALIPLLIAVYNETEVKRIGRLILVTGFCLTPIFVWLYNEVDAFLSSLIAWPLGIIGAMFIGEFIVGHIESYWKPKKLPRGGLSYLPASLQVFLIPIVGTAIEFLIMNLPVVMKIGGAFGFFSISRTQWLNTPILQLASFTGMYGVTFLILLVNCAIAYAVSHYKETRQLAKQSALILLMFGIISVYGLVSIPGLAIGDTNVVIIQAKPDVMETKYVNELYANLSEYSLKYQPEIILWPIWINYEVPEQPVGPLARQCANFSKEQNLYLVDAEGVVSPDGKIECYDAPYLFPHVLDGFIPFDLNKILPRIHGFDTRSGKIGILDCMESASTIPANQLIEDGARFIVVTSADRPVIGAFQGLIGGNVVYRAVEHRVYSALFFGSGGSIIVDPYGRIIEDTALEEEIVAGKISFTNERTFYTDYGDVFGWTVVGLAFVLVGYNLYLKTKSSFMYCGQCKAQIAKDVEICPECGRKPKESRWEKSDIGKLWKFLSKK